MAICVAVWTCDTPEVRRLSRPDQPQHQHWTALPRATTPRDRSFRSESISRSRSKSRVGSLGLWLLALSVSGAVTADLAWAQTSGPRMIEGIAAQVGNEIILSSEVYELSAPVEERLREAGLPSTEIARIRSEALDRLIEGHLLSSVVDRLELGADREEVDSAINAIAQENGISLEQLLASIESHGLSIEEYRDKIRKEIERSKVVNAMVRSRVQISDEEVMALYEEEFGNQRSGGEEVHLRHILVMAGEGNDRSQADACEIAGSARIEIETGTTTFPAIAQSISDMLPERGGDLGWMHQSDLAAWMADTVNEMQPGEVSPVVEMPFGCNLLELVERREFQPIDFEQAKPQLQNQIFQQKTEIEYGKWLDVLRTQTYIERKGAFAAGGLGG
jgi:peptidyl-prolyl cis-trans isomerase SurA